MLQPTAPAMRGRVISCYLLAYTGLVPLGSLLVGAGERARPAPAYD